MENLLQERNKQMGETIIFNRWQKLLLIYWLLIPVLFYFYLVLLTIKDQVSLNQLIQQVPGVTVGFLTTCLMLIQATMLFKISQKSVAKNGMLGRFLWFSLIQQILTGNLPGALLSFLAERKLFIAKETINKKTKLFSYGGMILVGLTSLLILFVMIQMKGANK